MCISITTALVSLFKRIPFKTTLLKMSAEEVLICFCIHLGPHIRVMDGWCTYDPTLAFKDSLLLWEHSALPRHAHTQL